MNSQNLTKGDTFYIGAICKGHDCAFSIMTQIEAEYTLEDGIEFQTHLYKEDARVFKYKIPLMIADDSTITVKASAYRGTAHDFSLSLLKESGDEMGKAAVPAWKKG